MSDFERMSREELVAAARGLEAELAPARAAARGTTLPRTLGVEDDSLSRFESRSASTPRASSIAAACGATAPGRASSSRSRSWARTSSTTAYDLHADQFVTKPVGLNVLAGELKIIEGLAARARQAAAG